MPDGDRYGANDPDRLPADDDTDELWEILGKARVQFWDCPVQHPRDPVRVRIEWDGDVATCLDCGRTNKDAHNPHGDREA